MERASDDARAKQWSPLARRRGLEHHTMIAISLNGRLSRGGVDWNPNSRALHRARSPLARRRGLERSCRAPQIGAQVASHAEAWIGTIFVDRVPRSTGSPLARRRGLELAARPSASRPRPVASHAEAWIGTAIESRNASRGTSPLARRRGLEQSRTVTRSPGRQVASHAEAWIGTMRHARQCSHPRVASRAEAWIGTCGRRATSARRMSPLARRRGLEHRKSPVAACG